MCRVVSSVDINVKLSEYDLFNSVKIGVYANKR